MSRASMREDMAKASEISLVDPKRVILKENTRKMRRLRPPEIHRYHLKRKGENDGKGQEEEISVQTDASEVSISCLGNRNIMLQQYTLLIPIRKRNNPRPREEDPGYCTGLHSRSHTLPSTIASERKIFYTKRTRQDISRGSQLPCVFTAPRAPSMRKGPFL